MYVLAKKHIPVSGQCPVRAQGAEDVKHLIFTCNRARDVWEALGVKKTIQEAVVVDRSGSTILEEILQNNFRKPSVLGSLGLKETIEVATWYIWCQRRQYCKGEHVVSPSRTVFAIFGLALNYGGAESRSEPRVVGWEKPVPSCYKLNVDACFFPNGTGSVAAILRDHKGIAVAGKSWIGDNFINATTTEESAIFRGLQLVEDLGCVLRL
jgi:hypothetical protein